MSHLPSWRRLRQASLPILAVLIAGCGGGGGGGGGSGGDSSITTPATAAWSEQAYVKASNAKTAARFGSTVAISGDTLVVGAPGEASNQTTITNGSTASADSSVQFSGAAYVFVRSGTTWTQQAYLKASNADAGDYFGGSVAISGDTIIVGAHNEDSGQTTITNGSSASADNSVGNAGAVYVFVRNGSNWSQQAYLKSAVAKSEGAFADTLAISGDTIVVGSYGDSSSQTTITNGSGASADNSARYAGSAYVFTRSGSIWSQQAYLKASNARANANFGMSVAVNADTIVVGAIGEASNQTTITNGSTASADNSADYAGAAYVFVRSGTTWSQQAYLKASNANAGDSFGVSVAISGETIVVGAHDEASSQTTVTNGSGASADNSAAYAGAAYVFVRSGTSWSQQAYLKAPNAGTNDYFGSSVAIQGDTIVVGAWGESSVQASITNGSGASADNTIYGAGAAYVFLRNASVWSQQAYLKAPNPSDSANFGVSVALSNDTIASGARYEASNQPTITNGAGASTDRSASLAGAAYVIKRGN